ncbi:MAG: isoprenylcysteine carboxylmethyltransferase family protein [Caldilineaceae bacterium]
MKPLLFDVPRLYGNIFILAIVLWVFPEIVGAFLLRSTATASHRDRGSYLAVVGGIVIGVVGAFACAAYLPQLAVTRGRYTIFWAGILLMLAGVALRWYAIRTLGRSFTQDVAIRIDHTLVQTGPYRTLRHPAYSGTLLTMLGMALVLANWGSLVIVLLGGVSGLLYRIKVEEKALLECFGQSYQDYMQQSYHLIPYVW